MRNERNTIWKIVRALNDSESNGGLWLPNIQRPFVWSEDQIDKLFDSIMRQYLSRSRMTPASSTGI